MTPDHRAAPIHFQRHDSALGRWLLARWRPPRLAGVVDHLWYFEGTVLHPRERVFPDGRLEFNVQLGPCYGEVRGDRVEWFAPTCITGLMLRPSVLEAPRGPSVVLGVRLLPTGAYAVLGTPIHELTGVTVDLADVVGQAAAELAERCAAAELAERYRAADRPARRGVAGGVACAGGGGDGTILYHLGAGGIDTGRAAHARVRNGDGARTDPGAAIVPGGDGLSGDAAGPGGAASRAARRLRVAADWLAERVACGRMADPAIAWAAAAIERAGGAVSVTALRERAGWSKSRFATLFREQVGVGPRRLARLVRFRRALELVSRGNLPLSRVALAAGYYDQPHFNAEFRELAGFTPGEFRASRRYPDSLNLAEPAH